MLPEPLIAAFWDDVRSDLVRDHGLTARDAATAVAAYRDHPIARKIGDWLYHRDAEHVAVNVANGWRSGFLRPAAAG